MGMSHFFRASLAARYVSDGDASEYAPVVSGTEVDALVVDAGDAALAMFALGARLLLGLSAF